MAYALYRKYRPKTFSDIVGQENVVDLLRNAAATDRISHAYLLCGSRGTGKTTTARLIAKIANCTKRQSDAKFRKTGEPCNECAACTAIDLGQAIDVVEIDAASNRGIDEIRNLKEAAKFAPSQFAKKVFIIDEAHALTKDAAQAMLKLLEEPPAHALFILATTEPEKLPATILSRTQRFDFRRLTHEQVVEKLSRIAKEEGISIEDGALRIIATGSEGSVRDAESLLDQLTAVGNKKITEKLVETTLGRTGFDKISGLITLIITKDTAGALTHLQSVYAEGYNIADLSKDLMRYVRQLIGLAIDPKLSGSLKKMYADNELAVMQSQSKEKDPREYLELLKKLVEAHQYIQHSPLPVAPLEIAIAEYIGKNEMPNS